MYSPVRDLRRRTLACVLSWVILGVTSVAAPACSRDPEAAQAEANTLIGVETSSLVLTIENKTGGPLIDLTVGIVAAGGNVLPRWCPGSRPRRNVSCRSASSPAETARRSACVWRGPGACVCRRRI
jgi:hypothetical protein